MNDDLEAFLYHPVAAGMAAAFALVASLLGPAALGFAAVETGVVVLSFGATYLLGVGTTLAGVWAFNRVLHGTLVHDWVAEFLGWADTAGIRVPGGGRA